MFKKSKKERGDTYTFKHINTFSQILLRFVEQVRQRKVSRDIDQCRLEHINDHEELIHEQMKQLQKNLAAKGDKLKHKELIEEFDKWKTGTEFESQNLAPCSITDATKERKLKRKSVMFQEAFGRFLKDIVSKTSVDNDASSSDQDTEESSEGGNDSDSSASESESTQSDSDDSESNVGHE